MKVNIRQHYNRQTHCRTWIWLEYDWYSMAILFNSSVSLEKHTLASYWMWCIWHECSLKAGFYLSCWLLWSAYMFLSLSTSECRTAMLVWASSREFWSRSFSWKEIRLPTALQNMFVFNLQEDIPVKDRWCVCSVWSPPPLTCSSRSPHGSW